MVKTKRTKFEKKIAKKKTMEIVARKYELFLALPNTKLIMIS